MKNKCLFLDRDGIINHDYNYVHKIADFEFVDGIFDLTKKAQELGYLIIVVTNQAGVAKGLYTEQDLQILTEWKTQQFLDRGIKITETYYCPYHFEGVVPEFTRDSEDRKPNPGMILKAIAKYNIDPAKSLLIGDRESDIEAALNANLATQILFRNDAVNNYKNTKAKYVIESHKQAEAYL